MTTVEPTTSLQSDIFFKSLRDFFLPSVQCNEEVRNGLNFSNENRRSTTGVKKAICFQVAAATAHGNLRSLVFLFLFS